MHKGSPMGSPFCVKRSEHLTQTHEFPVAEFGRALSSCVKVSNACVLFSLFGVKQEIMLLMKRYKKQNQGNGAPQQGMVPVSVHHSPHGAHSQRQGAYAAAGAGYAGAAPNPSGPSNPYSRDSYQPPKKRRKGPIIALIVVMVLVLLVGGVAFAGVVYMNSIGDKLHDDVSDELKASLSSESVQPGEPFYCLIMGTDRSEERAESDEFAGDNFRSDSMILARIDPAAKTVALVSIERDTYVDIEGYGPNKLNASAALGGAPLVVSTISKFAGVPISHYVSVDFDGFKAAVDGLGGIEVDVPMTIDDNLAGGHVDAGLQTLNGDQALILCRSRHAYDDYGSGDYYRMANQRLVLGAIAKKLMSSDVLTMTNTLNAMADYITTDMSVSDIISVATDMRGIDTDNDIWSAMNPTYSSYENDVWYEYSDNDAWRKMMERVDAGLPPYEDENRNANTGGTLDGTVTGNQETGGLLSGSGGTSSSGSSSGSAASGGTYNSYGSGSYGSAAGTGSGYSSYGADSGYGATATQGSGYGSGSGASGSGAGSNSSYAGDSSYGSSGYGNSGYSNGSSASSSGYGATASGSAAYY